ncbi:MAG TPA: HEPN domain-containing protein [Acidimicrobiales bacterium]|nr:HEPN domain-containing protein [Acidimicrobiales bacterium]
MDRAHLELEAAELLAGHGFAAPAVSRAYYAAFYAAEEALALVGVVRSKHSGVVAAVATVLVRQHGLDPAAGRLLRSLFERRSRADYGIDDPPAEEATQALADAAAVVGAIGRWMATRGEHRE